MNEHISLDRAMVRKHNESELEAWVNYKKENPTRLEQLVSLNTEEMNNDCIYNPFVSTEEDKI